MSLAASDRASRIQDAVFRVHANAMASHAGGAPFGVLLGSTTVEPFGAGAADASAYTLRLRLQDAPSIAEGDTLLIDDIAYTVSSPVRADPSGWINTTVYPQGAP